jgi:outer membrane receptor for ferrienterochelin and colicin
MFFVYYSVKFPRQSKMKYPVWALFIIVAFFTPFVAAAQNNGTIIGSIRDKETQELIIGAVVALEGTGWGTQSDSAGKYKITGIAPGSYNLLVIYTGYKKQRFYNLLVSNGNALVKDIELEKEDELKEIVIRSINFGKKMETPLSVHNLSTEEIRSNPGGNFDISKVIQALPGVGGTSGSAARNDLIIRGGAPSENVYYLDGVEVPQINHFSTQGASGGPQGILNVSFIEDATLSTSSFAAKYDNALSSVLQFKQKEGNPDKLQANARLSSTELALTCEGPIDSQTTFLASARRSYLQYFFKAIDLPIRPNYWDFQYKVTRKINAKTTLTAIGIGAIDEFTFAAPKNSTPEKEYIIRSLPTINQWNYTVGFSLKKLIDKGFYTVTASRNMFNNKLDQFEDADYGNESRRTFKSASNEIENKLRWETNKFYTKWKFSYGASVQYVKYNNDLFAVVSKAMKDSAGNTISPARSISANSGIDFFKYGLFGSVNRKVMQDKLSLTLGVRTDMNSFQNDGNNPLQAISPRLSGSYAVNSKLNINASVGRYAKLPVYTILGYKDPTGAYANKDTKYITCDHYVAGLELIPKNALRITLEGFYKQYGNYPVSVANNISIANQGADFGTIGNERVSSNGKGRAYGLELFVQQKLTHKFFITASYTLFHSQFTGNNDNYISSSWDSRHLVSLILGKKFNKGWEIGAKYRFSGGTPYTPFDTAASRRNYQITGQGTPDYARLNGERLPVFNQLDIRIDKKFNFKHSTLDVYFDFQNASLAKTTDKDYYTFKRNADNSYVTTDGKALSADGSNAVPLFISNVNQNFTPAIGIIFEF